MTLRVAEASARAPRREALREIGGSTEIPGPLACWLRNSQGPGRSDGPRGSIGESDRARYPRRMSDVHLLKHLRLSP